MTFVSSDSLSEIAGAIAQALVRVSTSNEVARISLPLMYPGGGMVGVEISRLRDDFLVSDAGGARREAGLLGGEKSFYRIASEVAQKFSVRFDSNMFFDLNVAEHELISAVVAVANAAKTAVENTAMHLALSSMPIFGNIFGTVCKYHMVPRSNISGSLSSSRAPRSNGLRRWNSV